MSVLRILNASGDRQIQFTEADNDEAKKEFDSLVGHGAMAYRSDGTGDNQAIKSFEPGAKEIVIVQQMRGG